MIVSATFRNILSFDKDVIIHFIASKSSNLPQQISRGGRDSYPLLKTSLILGPNGSGKSNICRCIYFMQNLATGNFHSDYCKPFKLGEVIHNESFIQMVIKVDKNFYEYSVTFTSSVFIRETLYKLNLRSRKMLFDRIKVDQGYKYTFGKITGGTDASQFLSFVSKGCPSDESFLHEYVKRNSTGIDDIIKVHEWFDSKLNIIFPESKFRSMPVFLNKDKQFANNINELLGKFKSGAEMVKMVSVDFDQLELPQDAKMKIIKDLKSNPEMIITMVNQEAVYFFEMENNGISCSKEVTIHKNALGKDVTFDLNEESDGTKRLLDFLPLLIDVKENASVYLIDELDRSLHTLLTKQFLGFYFSLLTPEKDCQLICTTHETYLLDDDRLRPEQFWFIKKKKNGASSLFTMGNTRLRKVVSNAYLNENLDLKEIKT